MQRCSRAARQGWDRQCVPHGAVGARLGGWGWVADNPGADPAAGAIGTAGSAPAVRSEGAPQLRALPWGGAGLPAAGAGGAGSPGWGGGAGRGAGPGARGRRSPKRERNRSGAGRSGAGRLRAALGPGMSSSAGEQCRSPVGLDCCNCCLDLVGAGGGENNNPGSPTASGFRQLREQLEGENLNAAKLSSIMRQDSLEPVVRDPCYLFNQGICNRNIDQTLLSILLLFHRWVPAAAGPRSAAGCVPRSPDPALVPAVPGGTGTRTAVSWGGATCSLLRVGGTWEAPLWSRSPSPAQPPSGAPVGVPKIALRGGTWPRTWHLRDLSPRLPQPLHNAGPTLRWERRSRAARQSISARPMGGNGGEKPRVPRVRSVMRTGREGGRGHGEGGDNVPPCVLETEAVHPRKRCLWLWCGHSGVGAPRCPNLPPLLRPSPQCPHLHPLLFCSNLNFLLLGNASGKAGGDCGWGEGCGAGEHPDNAAHGGMALLALHSVATVAHGHLQEEAVWMMGQRAVGTSSR